AFYFNSEGAFLGKVTGGSNDDVGLAEDEFFLATPLLPCALSNGVHGSVKKYTGNNLPGPVTDRLTEVIHAFVHFTYIYTRDSILFCDLQGALDKKGRLCLIDPQAHTYASCPVYLPNTVTGLTILQNTRKL
ncbi:hypothetical protein PHLGIDRAFT_65167, partial [Phlebiopsis gigantea 11061_1 CR5-6]